MDTPAAREPIPPTAPPVMALAAAGAKVDAGSRARRPAPKRPASKGTRYAALAAALLFAPLAVWLAHQDPPVVTHAEAVNLALAIEQAKDQPAIGRLVHFEEPAAAPEEPSMPGAALPPGAAAPSAQSSRLAAFIAFAKSHGDYTFLDTRTDARGERSLVFRCAHDGVLLDYHELRLGRSDGQVVVCELWSMSFGGWIGELMEERREILAAKELAGAAVDFMQQVDALDPEHLEAAFQKLHRRLRTSRCIGLRYLMKIGPQNYLPFRVAFVEFRAENPDNLAADLLL